ncbi:hypothetical protein GCM10018779_49910 [Streptomyces griseocarneus]|nr:hypothetical protein GCM10018779_49910 [Streptomyces griseocarneus]
MDHDVLDAVLGKRVREDHIAGVGGEFGTATATQGDVHEVHGVNPRKRRCVRTRERDGALLSMAGNGHAAAPIRPTQFVHVM